MIGDDRTSGRGVNGVIYGVPDVQTTLYCIRK